MSACSQGSCHQVPTGITTTDTAVHLAPVNNNKDQHNQPRSANNNSVPDQRVSIDQPLQISIQDSNSSGSDSDQSIQPDTAQTQGSPLRVYNLYSHPPADNYNLTNLNGVYASIHRDKGKQESSNGVYKLQVSAKEDELQGMHNELQDEVQEMKGELHDSANIVTSSSSWESTPCVETNANSTETSLATTLPSPDNELYNPIYPTCAISPNKTTDTSNTDNMAMDNSVLPAYQFNVNTGQMSYAKHATSPILTNGVTLSDGHIGLRHLVTTSASGANAVLPVQTPLLQTIPATSELPTMSPRKISNHTNDRDPNSIRSRVFVGNLNTFIITKEFVESVFQRYGTLAGVSMHKGYAFIQYTCEQDARNAVKGEDLKVYAAQAIDVNLVSEPKPNRPSRKKSNAAVSNQRIPTLVTPVDAARVMTSSGCVTLKRPAGKLEGAAEKPNGTAQSDGMQLLVCATCNARFSAAMDLVVHCQVLHQMAIIGPEHTQHASAGSNASTSSNVGSLHNESIEKQSTLQNANAEQTVVMTSRDPRMHDVRHSNESRDFRLDDVTRSNIYRNCGDQARTISIASPTSTLSMNSNSNAETIADPRDKRNSDKISGLINAPGNYALETNRNDKRDSDTSPHSRNSRDNFTNDRNPNNGYTRDGQRCERDIDDNRTHNARDLDNRNNRFDNRNSRAANRKSRFDTDDPNADNSGCRRNRRKSRFDNNDISIDTTVSEPDNTETRTDKDTQVRRRKSRFDNNDSITDTMDTRDTKRKSRFDNDDSRTDNRRASRFDNNDSRTENRRESRFDNGDSRTENRRESRFDNDDSRTENRRESRFDNDDSRTENRRESRFDNNDSRTENRRESRFDNDDARTENRRESRFDNDSKTDNRDTQPDSRGSRFDNGTTRSNGRCDKNKDAASNDRNHPVRPYRDNRDNRERHGRKRSPDRSSRDHDGDQKRPREIPEIPLIPETTFTQEELAAQFLESCMQQGMLGLNGIQNYNINALMAQANGFGNGLGNEGYTYLRNDSGDINNFDSQSLLVNDAPFEAVNCSDPVHHDRNFRDMDLRDYINDRKSSSSRNSRDYNDNGRSCRDRNRDVRDRERDRDRDRDRNRDRSADRSRSRHYRDKDRTRDDRDSRYNRRDRSRDADRRDRDRRDSYRDGKNR